MKSLQCKCELFVTEYLTAWGQSVWLVLTSETFEHHLFVCFCLRWTDSDSCMQTTFSERPLYGFSKGWLLLISHICSPYDQPLENCTIYIRDIYISWHIISYLTLHNHYINSMFDLSAVISLPSLCTTFHGCVLHIWLRNSPVSLGQLRWWRQKRRETILNMWDHLQ